MVWSWSHFRLLRPPDALRRSDALVSEGWVSPLAARLLGQTLALGRNILVVGPWAASVELASALLAEGAVGFIQKPFTMFELSKAVSEALGMFPPDL